MKKVNIGVAGLGFGKEFAAIYCDHPLVDKVAICTRNPETLNKVGEELGIPEELRFTNYDDMISHEELDAIHIVTPIKEHYPQSIKALRAGKHTACTVPMATSLDELREIVKTSREVGKIYTMMETSLYTREYLYVKRLKENGELSAEIFQEIFREILVKRAKLRAMHLLTRMDYTEAELEKKLMKGEYTPQAVKIAMDYVRSYHYLDDERYVARYLSAYQGRKSRRQMQFELERKGIPREMIQRRQEAMDDEEGCVDETNMIRQLLEKRCKHPKEADEKEKRRHYGYLLRKGFSSSEIQSVFREYFSQRE